MVSGGVSFELLSTATLLALWPRDLITKTTPTVKSSSFYTSSHVGGLRKLPIDLTKS